MIPSVKLALHIIILVSLHIITLLHRLISLTSIVIMQSGAANVVQRLKFNPYAKGVTKKEIITQLRLLGDGRNSTKQTLGALQERIAPYCDIGG